MKRKQPRTKSGTKNRDGHELPVLPACCDLVMKGGITSGVVYPSAAFELSKQYRFSKIGGASAGAIAAAVTAAAEYRRQQEHGGGADSATPNTSDRGLPGLEEMTAELKSEGLLRLFKPHPNTKTLFNVLLTFLDRSLSPKARLISVVRLLLWPHLWAIGLGLIITLAYLAVFQMAVFEQDTLSKPAKGAVAIVALAAVSFWAIAGPAAWKEWSRRADPDSERPANDQREKRGGRITGTSLLIVLSFSTLVYYCSCRSPIGCPNHGGLLSRWW